MLPPQTVLALLLASAFLLLLLATLSTPVIKPVPLGSTDGVRYGVWGFCTSGATATCSPITVGYDVGMFDLHVLFLALVGLAPQYLVLFF